MTDAGIQLIGYIQFDQLPLKTGQTVTIKKGTMVKQVCKAAKPAGKTFTVKIDHFISGCSTSNTKVRWVGSGGYWNEVDINEVLRRSL